MTDNHHPSSLSDTSFLPELPDSPDILEGLDKTLELLDAARTARRTELLSGRMFFPSYAEKANQLPTLYRNAKKSLSPLLRELWLLPAQFRVSQSGAVKFGDIAEKTHFEVVIALGKQTIRFLFHAIVLSRSVDQQTMIILRDQEERDELPNFDFGTNEADRENVSTLIRDLSRIPNGDWEQLKNNVELEAINLQRWRASGREAEESGSPPAQQPHQVTEPQVVQKSSQPVKVNLSRWGIGHDGKTWWLFYLQEDGKRFRWETRGKIDIPTGNQNRVAMRMLKDARLDEGRAAISKDEMHELFAEDNRGKTPKSLQQSVITPTMNKLRSAIRKSLERVRSGNITADPIPYRKKEGIWQSMVMFGVATKDDHGKLTLHLGNDE